MRCNHEREDSNAFGHTVTNQQDTIISSFLSECTRKKYPSSNIKHVFSKLKQTASKTTTSQHGCFLKWWYPTTMGVPTKSDHFGVFWGYHHFRKPPHQASKMLDRNPLKAPLLSNGRIFLSCHLAPFDSGWSIQWTLRRCGDVQELEVGS